MERSRAKKQRQFSKADALEERLLQDHQVQVDDARQEWSFVLPTLSDDTSYYVPSPLGIDDDDDDGLDEATHLIIQQQLHDRCVARHSKQYAQADVIRDALLQQYSVVIDDRTREYKVVTGTTTKEGEDAFVAQAQASQRSAFARTQKQKQRQEESLSQDAPTRCEDDDEDDDDESDRLLDQEIRSIVQQERQEEEEEEEEEEIQSSSSRKVMVEDANNIKDDKDDVAQDEEVELLSTLTVVALKEKLREAGLPLGGRKAELIKRLLLQSSISTQL